MGFRGIITLLLALLLSACFTNSGPLSSSGKGKGRGQGESASTISSVNYSDSESSGNSLKITNVVRNVNNNTTVIDILGDGSGSMGTKCRPLSSAGSAAGSNTCECRYSYNVQDTEGKTIATEDFIEYPQYTEDNLIRCNYSKIYSRPNIKLFKLKIRLVNIDKYSNEVTFSPYDNDATVLDSSNPDNFAKVKRYQCRPIISVPYMFDGSIYDPFQSEDKNLTYPLNFYTTNRAGTLVAWLKSGVAQPDGNDSYQVGWDCTGKEDELLTNDKIFPIFSSQQPTVTTGNSDYIIYPHISGQMEDRSTFYIAKAKSGIFDLPVNAPVAPNLFSALGGAHEPIGWAVSPIKINYNEYTCPSDITIPVGYKWVKVWLFRSGNIPIRQHKDSTKIRSMQYIMCNPGKWLKDPKIPSLGEATLKGDHRVIPNCGTSAADLTDAGKYIATQTSPPNGLIDRVFNPIPGNTNAQQSACVRLDYSELHGGNPDLSLFSATGFDQWLITNHDQQCGSTSGLLNYFPCQSKTTTQVTLPQPQPPKTAYTNQLTDTNQPPKETKIDYASREDYIYVTTPVTIQANQMQNSFSSNSSVLKYIPYRFMNIDDCAIDSNGNFTNCSSSTKFYYSLFMNDKKTDNNTEQQGAEPDGHLVTPFCALQPRPQ